MKKNCISNYNKKSSFLSVNYKAHKIIFINNIKILLYSIILKYYNNIKIQIKASIVNVLVYYLRVMC